LAKGKTAGDKSAGKVLFTEQVNAQGVYHHTSSGQGLLVTVQFKLYFNFSCCLSAALFTAN